MMLFLTTQTNDECSVASFPHDLGMRLPNRPGSKLAA